MPAPAVIAAIIGAVTTVATSAAGEVSREVNSAGSGCGATVANESEENFSIHAFSPNHGHFIQSPSINLFGMGYENSKFMAAVRAKFGNKPDSTDVDSMLNEWMTAGRFESYAKSSVMKYDGTGSGAGFESGILLTSISNYYCQIAILIRKKPGGDYGVGLGVANYPFYKNNDDDGENLIDHIKDVHTSRCQYSDGGGSISVQIGHIKVSASSPGVVNKILIQSI